MGFEKSFSYLFDTKESEVVGYGIYLDLYYYYIILIPVSLKISPNDQLLLVRGDLHLLVYHRGLEKIIATFTKPDTVPEEFRLPKAHYVQMKFTHADFTKDSDFVVGTIFRY